MPTTAVIERAKGIYEEWIPKVEAVLKKFEQERRNPFAYGYCEAHRNQSGYTDETAEPVGAFWFLRNNLLWLTVSVDGWFKVTLELPLKHDLGVDEGFEERLFARLEEAMEAKLVA